MDQVKSLIKSEISEWRKYYNQNIFYHQDLQRLAINLIPQDASVIEFGCRGGELLGKLPNKIRVGVDDNRSILEYARKRNPKIKFVDSGHLPKIKFDYILLSHNLMNEDDIQGFIRSLRKISQTDTRIVVTYFNYTWKPFFDVASKLGLMFPLRSEPNWLTSSDVSNFFYLEGYENIKDGRRFIWPYNFLKIGYLFNKYISPLPIINAFCLINYAVYRSRPIPKDYSVSVIIPARNESGNMKGVLAKIPKMGRGVEVIFVEGHSKDDTYDVIKKEIADYKGRMRLQLFKQKGVGKGDAVRLGFTKAKNDILMILDADLTVAPKDLPKFYKIAASGRGDFVMGSRLVYPMEKLAMRTLNILGNKFFSLAFSFLLGQKIKDTLAGTKVLTKENYRKIEKNRKFFGDFDPFGDFDLIFGAAKLNLKIVEIPIRYKQRTYGTTNISRFRHGVLLLRMVLFAALKIKFI